MTTDPPSQPGLLELIEKLEDRELTEGEHARLMEMLKGDAAARSRYLEHMQLVGFLRQEARSRHLLGHFVPLSSGFPGGVKRSLRRAFVAAAACVALIGVIIYFLRPKEPPLRITFASSPGTQWTISHPEQGVLQVPELTVGSRLEVNQGAVDLVFPQEVRGVLQGPAEIEILSNSIIRFRRGSGWFTVGEPGRGFTVKTPSWDVVDLGTEFGVWVPREKGDIHEEVHVRKGVVEIVPVAGGERVSLAGGEGIKISEGGVPQRDVSEDDRFLKELPDTIPYIHWSFDEKTDRVFASQGSIAEATAYPATLRYLRDRIPSERSHVQGRFGNAVALHGLGDFIDTDWPGVAGDGPRTVSVWIKALPPDLKLRKGVRESAPRRRILSWGLLDAEVPGGSWELDFPRNGDDLIFGTVYGTGNSKMITLADILDGRWHHIAVVYSGLTGEGGAPEMKHYIDGVAYHTSFQGDERRVPGRLNTVTHLPASQPLRFGLGAIEPVSDLPTFKVTIDEVYIFEGALTRWQIRALRLRNMVDGSDR